MNNLLERLQSDDFQVPILFAPTPLAVYKMLLREPLVLELRRDLAQGAITDSVVREFVVYLMKDLHRGQRFPHDVVLAAIAVAMESRATEFAEQYLTDLAKLRTAEMALSIRVARECLKNRVGTRSKVTTLGSVSPKLGVLSYEDLGLAYPGIAIGEARHTVRC
jgi:hypothetical protein